MIANFLIYNPFNAYKITIKRKFFLCEFHKRNHILSQTNPNKFNFKQGKPNLEYHGSTKWDKWEYVNISQENQ